MKSDNIIITCIASNCNTTVNTYDYRIKVIDTALEEIWVDID